MAVTAAIREGPPLFSHLAKFDRIKIGNVEDFAFASSDLRKLI